jgi:hypothetical protein
MFGIQVSQSKFAVSKMMPGKIFGEVMKFFPKGLNPLKSSTFTSASSPMDRDSGNPHYLSHHCATPSVSSCPPSSLTFIYTQHFEVFRMVDFDCFTPIRVIFVLGFGYIVVI